MPLLRIVSDEVAALAGLFIDTRDFRSWIRASEFHTLLSGFWRRDHCFSRGQKQRVALAVREKLHLAVGLSLIGFEAEGQLAIVGNII